MEYTKGEWKYNCPYIDTTEGHRIAQVYNYWVPGYSDNAKLLAAAPDMYEALKDVLGMADSHTLNMMCEPGLTIEQKIQQAISKAEGK